jgi:glycosyltransferase involved in cell wall biosynthesis
LIEKFRELGNVYCLAGMSQDGVEARRLAAVLADGCQHAIVNSTVSGLFAGVLDEAGIRVVSLVHEMPGVIRDHDVVPHARALAAASQRIFFPATIVRDGFANFAHVDEASSEIRAQGLYTRNRWRGARNYAEPRAALRAKLGLPLDAEIVLSVGYADRRKGVDLFVDAGLAMLASGRQTHFVWVGHADEELLASQRKSIDHAGLSAHFHFTGMDFNTDDYYAGADLYALTSREDPFPSVVLEALSVGLAVVAFAASGGSADILARGCGVLVDTISSRDLAVALSGALEDSDLRKRLGEAGMALVANEFSFRRYIFDLLDAVGLPQAKVTAIVPNFNYAHLLGERLRSIDAQTVAVYELIVLDDRSTDDSLDTLVRLRSELRTEFSVVENAVNSGSVFRQWLRGAELAHGDMLWIAEADDACEPTFLASVLPPLVSEADVVLSFAQSKQIDDHGRVVANDYLAYTDDVDATQWRSDYIRPGVEEIRQALAIKNTIPNVSAVVFRADSLRQVLREGIEEIASFRIAGDWVTYMMLAAQGRVAYTAQSLNRHRRHASSITLGSSYAPHLLEILKAQQIARQRFDVPAKQSARALEYSEGLFVSFKLGTDSARTLAQFDQAAPYLL